LTHIAPCTIESSKINLGLLPIILQASDIEREVLSCSSMLLNGVNQYIRLPINSSLDLGITNQMTFESVFKLSSVGSSQKLISKYQTSLQRGIIFQVSGSGEARFDLQNFGGVNGLILISTGASILPNVWYNLIATYNGSTDASGVNFYLNGVFLPVNTIISNTLSSTIINSNSFEFGAVSSAGLYSDLTLNASRVWDIEMNATEVQQEFDILQDYFQDPTSLPSAVRESSLIINSLNGVNAVFDGNEYQIPDLTGITTGYETVNCEEVSLVQDCP
jgi:hypothetical protein